MIGYTMNEMCRKNQQQNDQIMRFKILNATSQQIKEVFSHKCTPVTLTYNAD